MFYILKIGVDVMLGMVCMCRWNKDGEYFARMSDNLISVYKTPVSHLLFYTSVPHAFVSLSLSLIVIWSA